MFRTSVLALSLVALLTASPFAWAQGNGNGNGNSGGNGAANGSANGGGNGQGNNGNGNGNGGANGNGTGNGNAGENRSSGAVPDTGQQVTVVTPATGAATTPGTLTESDVLQAVEAGRAVSLSRILPDVRARTGGEVIDAELHQVGLFLLYAIKVLTPAGKVTTEFYYARSGLHVEK